MATSNGSVNWRRPWADSVQYVGRVLRPLDGKTRVEVHDYVDTRVPVLADSRNAWQERKIRQEMDRDQLRP